MTDKVFTTAENNTWAHTLPGKMTSACVALVAPDNHVLMVKASYKNEWTFPSGVVDMGESPAQAAQRELAEETGLALELSPQDIVAVIYTGSDGASRDRFNIAFCKELPAQLPLTALAIPNDEITAAEWVPFPKVAQKAGGRASYHILQARLTGELQDMYNEILPMRRSGIFTEDAISH